MILFGFLIFFSSANFKIQMGSYIKKKAAPYCIQY